MDDTVGVRMQTWPDPVVGFPWYDSSHPCDAAGVCSPNQVDSYFFGHGTATATRCATSPW